MCAARRLFAPLLLLTACIAVGPGTPRAETYVDVELVLAVDVSQSMDPGEQALQRAGYVAALRHPDVLRAIGTGYHRRIGLTYFQWGSVTRPEILLPWTLIEDAADLERAAATLAAAPINTIRGTSISSAIGFGASLFAQNDLAGERMVIDISGDGPNSSGPPVVPARDAAVAEGIVINGLPFMLREPGLSPWSIPDLDIYYTDCVIGGPASFVLPVEDLSQFPEAIRRKLVLEIAGLPAVTMKAQLERREPRIDCLIGERLRRMWLDP